VVVGAVLDHVADVDIVEDVARADVLLPRAPDIDESVVVAGLGELRGEVGVAPGQPGRREPTVEGDEFPWRGVGPGLAERLNLAPVAVVQRARILDEECQVGVVAPPVVVVGVRGVADDAVVDVGLTPLGERLADALAGGPGEVLQFGVVGVRDASYGGVVHVGGGGGTDKTSADCDEPTRVVSLSGLAVDAGDMDRSYNRRSSSEHKRMASAYPAERAVEINATEQQLRSGNSPYTTGAAFAPSEVKEHTLGYDVKIPIGGAEIELQYKSLRAVIENRSFSRNGSYDGFRFPFEPEQAETLLLRAAGVGRAFYALPVVTSSTELTDALEKTVFVDVAGLAVAFLRAGVRHVSTNHDFGQLHDQSQLYVVPDHTDTPAAVYVKERSNSYANAGLYTKVPDTHVHTWEELVGGTLGGRFGTPVVRNGTRAPEYPRRCRYLASMNRLVSGETDSPEAVELVESYLNDQWQESLVREPLTDDASIVADGRTVVVNQRDGTRGEYAMPPEDAFDANETVVSVGETVLRYATDRDVDKYSEEPAGPEPQLTGGDGSLALGEGQRRVVGL
jgi:hypothetical protein